MSRFRIRSLLIVTGIVAIVICAARLEPVAISIVYSGPRGASVATDWVMVEPSAEVVAHRAVRWVPITLIVCAAAVWIFRKISD